MERSVTSRRPETAAQLSACCLLFGSSSPLKWFAVSAMIAALPALTNAQIIARPASTPEQKVCHPQQ